MEQTQFQSNMPTYKSHKNIKKQFYIDWPQILVR